MRGNIKREGLSLTVAALLIGEVLYCSVASAESWFGEPIVTALPMNGLVLATGHFDSDQNLDCAVGGIQGAARSLLVYEGDGAGGMTLREQIACPSTPLGWKALVAGDFDGDGRDDLAGTREPTGIYYQGSGGVFASEPVRLYLNGSPATFELLGSDDVDGDGFDDLVGQLPRYVYPKSRVYVYWGGSSGLSASPTVLQVRLFEDEGCEPGGYFTWLYEPRVRDVDGDGDLDLATFATYWSDDHCGVREGIGWFENVGGRQFAEDAHWAVVSEPEFSETIESYDFGRIDSDEFPDLVRSESEYLEALVYLGDEGGDFTLVGSVEPGFSTDPTLFDIDLDGTMDLRTLEGETEIFRGVGDGTFVSIEPLPERLIQSQSCEVIAAGGPDLIGFRWGGNLFLVVYPNATGTTAHADAVERPMVSLRATPSVSSAGVRLEFIDVSENVRGGGPTVLSIVGADGSRIRELSMARAALGVWTTGWDGRDATGRRVPAGVFFARVDGAESVARFTIAR